MILIADGDEVAGAGLERMLTYSGFEALAVRSGMEAITLLELRRPTLVILDLHLKDFDGMTVLKAIRKDANFATVPVIIYTMAFADEIRRAALEHGAQEFIVKGTIGWKALAERVRAYHPATS